MPLVDQQQSYTLLSLNENDGQTTMTFQRAIQSCDEQDFHITVSSPNPQAHQLKNIEQTQIVRVFFMFFLKDSHLTLGPQINNLCHCASPL